MSSIIKQQSSGLATETQDGLVSTGTQTFGGDKTFSGNVAVDGDLLISNTEQYVTMSAGYKNSITANTWYPAYSFGTSQYGLTAFMLFLAFENNAADAQNTTALFMSPSGGAYLGNTSASYIRISGSTSLEVRMTSTSPYTLEVRTTGSGAVGNPSQILRWWIIHLPGN